MLDYLNDRDLVIYEQQRGKNRKVITIKIRGSNREVMENIIHNPNCTVSTHFKLYML